MQPNRPALRHVLLRITVVLVLEAGSSAASRCR
jgi:hypothetical protein